MKGDAHPKDAYDMSCLRVVTSTGSPLSPDGFHWIYQNVGDVWLTSQSGGTDIASIFIGGVPTLPVRAGFLQAPALGVRVESWSDEGKQTEGRGELVVTEPLPSMPLCFWGDDDGSRYHESYFDVFPGVWRHGDFVEFTESGVVIHGRSDSTLNRNGLRLGTADLYAVVDALPCVEEALVVGVERGTDYYMPLFVKKMPGAKESDVRREIELAIRGGLSARYLPDEIFFVSGIPHTKTGKKLEVPIKRLFQGATVGQVVDVGAVDNALLLDEFSQLASSRQGALS
jgi:acetoacetyl-CoA synthetase